MAIKKETAGYKGWAEVNFFEGKTKDGQMVGNQGFRNIITGQDYRPENGWDGEPPAPTGDLANVRHVSDAYREGYERIKWQSASQPSGS
jgi:hypothetical protein